MSKEILLLDDEGLGERQSTSELCSKADSVDSGSSRLHVSLDSHELTAAEIDGIDEIGVLLSRKKQGYIGIVFVLPFSKECSTVG